MCIKLITYQKLHATSTRRAYKGEGKPLCNVPVQRGWGGVQSIRDRQGFMPWAFIVTCKYHWPESLTRSSVVHQLYQHIFTGPSSVLNKVQKATKRSKAEIHSMTEVTGRTITYVCIQVRVVS